VSGPSAVASKSGEPINIPHDEAEQGSGPGPAAATNQPLHVDPRPKQRDDSKIKGAWIKEGRPASRGGQRPRRSRLRLSSASDWAAVVVVSVGA